MSCLSYLPKCKNDGGGDGSSARVYNEMLSGDYDCLNVDFVSSQAFDPSTVVVKLDGVTLDPSQYTLGVDNLTVSLIVDANDAKALNCAPNDDERLLIDYNLADAGSGGGAGNDCITFL